jgi:hypothetical protein
VSMSSVVPPGVAHGQEPEREAGELVGGVEDIDARRLDGERPTISHVEPEASAGVDVSAFVHREAGYMIASGCVVVRHGAVLAFVKTTVKTLFDKTSSGPIILRMDTRAALEFLMEWSERATWREIAKELGEELPVVYGWYRRGSVPKWRVRQLEAIAQQRGRNGKRGTGLGSRAA